MRSAGMWGWPLLTLVLAVSALAIGAAAPPQRERSSSVDGGTPQAVSPINPSGRFHRTARRPVPGVGRDVATNEQTLLMITGPRAPQRFRFDVDLPRGAALEQRGRGLTAVRGGGATLAVLEAPWAVDATGLEVATRFVIVDRDSFVQVVEHRPVGATYPVYADPWWVVPVLLRAGGQLLGRYVVRRATYEAAKRAAARLAARQVAVEVDELLAESPVKLLKLTRANFRENVRRRTHWRKASIKGYDAHHTLPVAFRLKFQRAGLNIHNPLFGHWWCSPAHRRYASRYNARWEEWLSTRSQRFRDTRRWRNRIERKRLAMVSNPAWSSTYQC